MNLNRLGLIINGSSVNYGIEQERLNNVKGARLRITTLKAKSGPAIELLEYITPNNGRVMPVNIRANDLWHWQIQITMPNIDPISSNTIRGLMVRDPDGHALSFY